MLDSRACGVLLHPTSLPSRFGIGDLGKNAYQFVDFLAVNFLHKSSALFLRIEEFLPLPDDNEPFILA